MGGVFQNVFVRLILYYSLAIGGLIALGEFLPNLTAAVDKERDRIAVGIARSSGPEMAQPGSDYSIVDPEGTMVVAMSILVALVVALPVAWVYQWTSRRKTYNQSLTQALVILPVAIATVVFLVKGSLALAFSLGGIVAAIRFRTMLRDTRDAVFLFMVIGIGLAAGVQLLLVSAVASVIFNLIVLITTSRDFGRNPNHLVGFSIQPRPPRKKHRDEAAH